MLDAHHHLWKYDAIQYPWIEGTSPLAQDYLIPELRENTTAAGVTGTVAVQARQSVEESDWLLDLSDQCDLIRGVVGWAPLADDDVGRHLDRLAQHPKFKAVRHVIQDEADDHFILGTEFNRGIAKLKDYELVYDILIFQRHLPQTIDFVDRHPGQPFVIDHIAKPVIHNGRIESDWQRGMTALAERDNVTTVKISGMVTEVTDDQIDEATLKNYFLESLEIFGPQRLCFGTDWPVCLLRINSYVDWANSVRDYVTELTTGEKNAVLQENCEKAYRL
ncbi:MAG TPA: amidohydrolase [Verrucomicrobiales bacterium]|nr:amidohydrolase [Verrucomicrobiales bacterium]HCQ38475.1 amidohydrolase [Verrucomicrobiales bacterium]|tara:strand:+ start:1528 stop:2358 length:831 start_codon:yes stop_codon:yes gene_type:complete